MNSCEKYIEAMNRYLDGDLPVSQISDLLEHLEVCPSCRARFEALKILSFEMRHMQKEPPEALHKNIMQAVNSTPRSPKRYAKAVATAAACAALLFIALQGDVFRFAGQSLFTSQSSQSETPYLGQQAADEAASQDAGTAAKAAARRSRRKRRRMPPNRNCAIQRRTQWVRSKRKWAIARLYTTQRISRCRPWIPVRSLPFTAWPWGMGRCPRHSPKRGSCTSQKRSAHISTSKPISLPSKVVQTCCSRRGSPL